jgi:hypothetical protein
MLTTDNHNIAPTTDVNKISIQIPCNNRKACGLAWAESSWIRWIYVAFWSWLNPILKIGYKRQLTEDDLFDLSPSDECSQLLKKFEIVLEHMNININILMYGK